MFFLALTTSGVDPGGMVGYIPHIQLSPPTYIYPLQHYDRGIAYVSPILWKLFNNILPYLYKYSDKITRFCSKNGWFLIGFWKNSLKHFSQNAKVIDQSGPKNWVFLPITCSKFAPKSVHKIAQFHFKKMQNFPASEGYTPLRHLLFKR